MIEDVVPSDGGLYSCMAVSASGNASRDVAIHSKTQLPNKAFPNEAFDISPLSSSA